MNPGQFLILLLIVGGLGTYSMMRFFGESMNRPTPAPTPTPAPIVVVVTPTPEPIVEPTPPPRRLAPEGVVYVVRYASIPIPGGVIGLEPGQRLTQLEDRGRTLIVTDGKYKGEIPVESVTNDLDIAALAARADSASQAKLQASLAQYRAEADKFLRAQQTADAAARNAYEAKRAAGGAVGGRDAFALSEEDKKKNRDARDRYEGDKRPRVYYVPR